MSVSYLRSAPKLTNHKGRSQVLRGSIVRVLQVLSIDAVSVSRVADSIAIDAHVQSLANPIAWDACRSESRETVDISSGCAAVVVYVAGQPRLVLWVTDEEDTLDGVEVGSSELRQGVHGSSGTLRVAFEDEAFVRRGGEGSLDLVDDLVRE